MSFLLYTIVSKYFKRIPISKTQRVVQKYKDGSIDIEILITDDMEIIPTVQGYLPFIKVIEPKRIKDKICKNIDDF